MHVGPAHGIRLRRARRELRRENRRADGRRASTRSQAGEVVIDAFAEDERRFAPPGDTREQRRNALDRGHGRPGIEGALSVLLVAQILEARGATRSEQGVVLLHALDRCRRQLTADELVDGRQHQAAIRGEILRRVGAYAGVDDRHQVVRLDVVFDEPPRRLLHVVRIATIDVQIVEHQHEDAARPGDTIRGHVRRRERRVRGRRLHRRSDRNAHARERGDFLATPVLENLDLRTVQVGDGHAPRIDGAHFDFDRVHARAKDGVLRALLGRQDGAAEDRGCNSKLRGCSVVHGRSLKQRARQESPAGPTRNRQPSADGKRVRTRTSHRAGSGARGSSAPHRRCSRP